MALYEDRVVKITELAGDNGVIENQTFIGCHIKGPAVIIGLENSAITNSNLGGPDINALFWEIPPSRPTIVGAIACKNCTFEKCTFQAVGFAGPPELRQQLAA